MLTPPSSAAVIPFPTPTATTQFEAWRENWIRLALADQELEYAPKLVACFILWFLNRQSRDCFPSFQTIADGIGVSRRTAIRAVAELKTHGYLRRQSRGKGKSNLYRPIGQVVSRVTLGSVTGDTSGSVTGDTLTSLVEPLTEPVVVADGAQSQKEGAGKTSSSSSPGAPKTKNGSAVGFDGQVLRPTAKQVDRWRRDYPLISDIVAELRHADDYFVDHPSKDGKWLWRASLWLKRENNARLKERRVADDEDSF